MLSESTTAAIGTSAVDACAAFAGGVGALRSVDLVGLDRDGLLEMLRSVELTRRQLAVVDHALVAEADQRGVAAELFTPNTAALLRGLLRISAAEAGRRVRAAKALGPGRSLTGEVLPPRFAAVAGAQAGGSISPEHAQVITRMVEELPHTVRGEHGHDAEAILVGHAETFDPSELAKIATRLGEVLDPDGKQVKDSDHQRNRDLTLTANRDGSYHLAGRLTPECGAIWRTILDSAARPIPTADGVADPRRPGQRLHDGFHDCGSRLLRLGDLPDCGGIPTMLVLHARADQAQTGDGYATSGHGDLIPMATALDLAADGATMSVLFNPHGGILDYGTTKRTAPAGMRLALNARDRGCTAPNCDRPAAWSQVHHVAEFASGGSTSVDNLVLACGYHHRNFPRLGWQAILINGVAHWIPPAWQDRTQTPRRNYHHHPELLVDD